LIQGSSPGRSAHANDVEDFLLFFFFFFFVSFLVENSLENDCHTICGVLCPGPYLNTPGVSLKQDTAAALIEAMQGTGVTRLVTLGSGGTNRKALEGQSRAWRWCGL
jgi:hypothetical protein